ncbi:MAG TPA: hypothetical protein VGE21_10800 [Flavobacteriales bacterium]
MARRILLLLFLLLAGGAWAQICGRKNLVTTMGVGGGGLIFTRADGPAEIMRGSVSIGFGFRYGLGERLSPAFRYDRIGVRRGILDAGPSRTASYQLGLHYVFWRGDRSEWDIGAGLGVANISLAAYTARLPREGHVGFFALNAGWSRMLSPTVGFHLSGHWIGSNEETISDEDGVVKDATGEPIRIGFRSISAEAGLLVRF